MNSLTDGDSEDIVQAGYSDHRHGREEFQMTQLERIHDATATARTYSTDSYPRSSTKIGEFDDGLSTFLNVCRKLFAIAFRMLRSAAEAEDIVQEVWLRWQTTNRNENRCREQSQDAISI